MLHHAQTSGSLAGHKGIPAMHVYCSEHTKAIHIATIDAALIHNLQNRYSSPALLGGGLLT